MIKSADRTEELFDLKTRLASEIIQKYVNYGIRMAIRAIFPGMSVRYGVTLSMNPIRATICTLFRTWKKL